MKHNPFIWLIIATGISAAAYEVHGFLAKNRPIEARVLVVEDWISERAIIEGVRLQNPAYYGEVVTAGISPGRGENRPDMRAAETLERAGVPAERIQSVAAAPGEAHNTLRSALALREWLKEHRPAVRSFNLLSETVHARKSHLTYRKVFGDDFTIGIIASKTDKYNTTWWFLSRTGLRLTAKNFVGWIYAAFENESRLSR